MTDTICSRASSAKCQQGLGAAVAQPDFQDVQDLELGEARIQGDYAKVRTEPNDGFFEFSQENGDWKIIFSR